MINRRGSQGKKGSAGIGRGLVRRGLGRLDAWFNALYGWRFNPLYHSGALVVACFVVLLVTGLYLLLFYRIGTPYESVAIISGQWWGGSWIRSLHRYVADLAVVAAVVHAVRMFVQRRTWGPRAMAWLSGVVLLGIFLVCGWTGYVMVWDAHGHLLAAEGARLFDALPVFSEPLVRAFAGEEDVPRAFFFMNLFAHIALPAGVALFLWVHVSRLARAQIMPGKPLFWGTAGVLTLAAVLWPAPLLPKANLLSLPADIPTDFVYGFWLPVARAMAAWQVWLAAAGGVALVSLVPVFTKPRAKRSPPPSWVNPRYCTGCEQCYEDCPYEAISMVPRDDGRDTLVALVEPAKCVSCGICAGSCAPMGVGPAGRDGRDQLVRVKEFLAEVQPGPKDVVVIGCLFGAVRSARDLAGASVYPVHCVGNLHTSVIEYLVRAGSGGVLVATCPPRDCRSREGVKWFEERVYNQREAELRDRVDRTRIRVVHAAEGEPKLLEECLALFRSQVRALARLLPEKEIAIDAECVVPEVPAGEEAVR